MAEDATVESINETTKSSKHACRGMACRGSIAGRLVGSFVFFGILALAIYGAVQLLS